MVFLPSGIKWKASEFESCTRMHHTTALSSVVLFPDTEFDLQGKIWFWFSYFLAINPGNDHVPFRNFTAEIRRDRRVRSTNDQETTQAVNNVWLEGSTSLISKRTWTVNCACTIEKYRGVKVKPCSAKSNTCLQMLDFNCISYSLVSKNVKYALEKMGSGIIIKKNVAKAATDEDVFEISCETN